MCVCERESVCVSVEVEGGREKEKERGERGRIDIGKYCCITNNNVEIWCGLRMYAVCDKLVIT